MFSMLENMLNNMWTGRETSPAIGLQKGCHTDTELLMISFSTLHPPPLYHINVPYLNREH